MTGRAVFSMTLPAVFGRIWISLRWCRGGSVQPAGGCRSFLRRHPENRMTDYFLTADEAHIKREKEKARELRSSPWWKRKRSSGLCYYCGRKFPAGELTMDHLVPVIRGGRSVRSNIVPACKECNSKKKYLLPLEWEEYLDTLKQDT
jgi:5-methylcytosine-specific restriction enzyme A